MKTSVIVGLAGVVVVAGCVTFAMDPRNQAAMKLMVENAAAEKPIMAAVALKVPFVKDPPPKRAYPKLYPLNFTWSEGARLKYFEMDGSYLETNGVCLNDLSESKPEDEESRSHLRFKFNPASDPIHPGHELLAVMSRAHSLRFAPLGAVDFDSVSSIPEAKFLPVAGNEQPAVWGLKAGDVVGIKVTVLDDSAEATAGAKPQPAQRRVFVAKLGIVKLSHDSVRYVYVYRTDGQNSFPPPAYSGEPDPDKE